MLKTRHQAKSLFSPVFSQLPGSLGPETLMPEGHLGHLNSPKLLRLALFARSWDRGGDSKLAIGHRTPGAPTQPTRLTRSQPCGLSGLVDDVLAPQLLVLLSFFVFFSKRCSASSKLPLSNAVSTLTTRKDALSKANRQHQLTLSSADWCPRRPSPGLVRV